MKSVIVGTAGHIDHGKSALVKALTGIDADRLEEEKRRGITIDIGFAHLEMPLANDETLRIGFIDVPGHERFVRNMLAGVGGIDLVLFVVAADESIKPQTREHFDICRLLSVNFGITVITKSDSVDKDTLEVVRLEVEDFVRGSFLDTAQSPIVCVSSLTGEGLDELRENLCAMSGRVPARNSKSFPRLPIDRVFTMKGFGTVVTGTLTSGTIRVDDGMEVFPGGRQVRVRGVQVHGEATEIAVAGQRTALNLAGVSTVDLDRGMTLTSSSTFQQTSRVDVSLSLLRAAKPLKHRTKVHFHCYTMESIAEIFLYEEKILMPGQTALAQVRLAAPALLLAGDRFIIRQFSPVTTIGGGKVLDGLPLAKSPLPTRISFLKIRERGDQEEMVKAYITRSTTSGLHIKQLVAATGWLPANVDKLTAAAVGRGEVIRVGDLFIHAPALQHLKAVITERTTRFHNENPLVGGMSKEVLREEPRTSDEIFAFALESLVLEKKAEVVGDLVRSVGRGVAMKDEEAESKKIIENAFRSAGLKVPPIKEVLETLKIDRARAQKIVTLLLRDNLLIKVSEDLIFHSEALEKLRKCIAAEKLRTSKIAVTRFKELTGVSRKYAIPLLEYLDRQHVTRRAGDERIIL